MVVATSVETRVTEDTLEADNLEQACIHNPDPKQKPVVVVVVAEEAAEPMWTVRNMFDQTVGLG